jgi:hypothetical protein
MLKAQMTQSIDMLRQLGVAVPDDIEARLERVYSEHRLGWRERKLTRAEKNQQRDQETTQTEQKVAQTKERYGLDDERWNAAKEMVEGYAKAKGIDAPITPDVIVHADRHLMAVRVIQRDLPNLAQNPKFGQILQETIRDLVENPGITEEQLAATLTEVFGEDDEEAKRQRRLSQKARERRDQEPRSAEAARGRKPVMGFSEIDEDDD